MNKRDKDGIWSNIGATHGEDHASMGKSELLLTSYVTCRSSKAATTEAAQVSIDYIRNNIDAAGDNGYILALAANALAAFDAKDDSTLKVCQRLDKLRQEEKELKVQYFPAKGTSLTYGRGDSVSVETSALATLAMIKTGQFNASVNQAMAYLVKTQASSGTWARPGDHSRAQGPVAGMGARSSGRHPLHHPKVNGEVATRGKIGKADAGRHAASSSGLQGDRREIRSRSKSTAKRT